MHTEQLTANINARIQEVAGYQTNIDNYTRMVAKITTNWCDVTLPYKGMDTQQSVEKIADDELLTKVSDLNFKDKLIATLRSERIEQRKAQLVLEVLQDQLKEI